MSAALPSKVGLAFILVLTLLLSACGGSAGDGGLSDARDDSSENSSSEVENSETESSQSEVPESDSAEIFDTTVPVALDDDPGPPPAGSPFDLVTPASVDSVTASPANIGVDVSAPAVDKNSGTLTSTSQVFPPSIHDIPGSNAHYSQHDYQPVDVIRMDVRTRATAGSCTPDDKDGCTLADVKADTNKHDDFTAKLPVHFMADDFADDGLAMNAEMRQRGGTTRLAPQKSFKIRFEDKDAVWRDERSILLNKHPFESDRIRNKLAFDLMSDIPHLLSFRTQFVNLWIDDGQGATDYGLFTHIESPGNRYLRRRGLDDNGRLYKVNTFNFSKDDISYLELNPDGSPLDEDRFEERLSIESGDDHRPLLKMMADLHDPAVSFETVFAKYFNENNVLTWMTVNFLLHQIDAISQNYMLYNPAGTERFYFLPWDYDGGFAVEPEPPAGFDNNALKKRLFYGYARAINNDFITRYYKRPGIHQRFLNAAAHLRKDVLSDERVNSLSTQYGELVRPWVTRNPDIAHNANFNEYSVLTYGEFISRNEEALQTAYGIPLPPVVQEGPKLINGQWVFEVIPAFDPTGGKLLYEVQVSSTPTFESENLLYRLTDVEVNSADPSVSIRVDASRIDGGTRYIRLIVRSVQEPERFWQVSANRHTEDGVTWAGVMAFDVPF